MDVGDVLIAGESVTDQHRIAAFGVEFPVCLIRDLKGGELDARVEPQRLVHPKTDNERMGIIRLARAIGGVKYDTDIEHNMTRSARRRHGGNGPAASGFR